MALWCHGDEDFLSEMTRLAPARHLDPDCTPERGDVLIVDLDHPTHRDVVARAAAAGCQVVAACYPRHLSNLVPVIRAGVDEVIARPLRSCDICRYCPPAASEPEPDVAAWRDEFASEIIGSSAALVSALADAMHAAEFDCPVLLTGESGTGKELLAKTIHRASRRAAGPFIPVNCPAIPRELVESELFGHAKGAFTGAATSRVGRFVAANRGTLMLDEIGEMDLDIQCKLLRALQEYRVTRVGDSASESVDVRVVAATNRDLESMASAGTFRADLLYRLNVVTIRLPALRERPEDLPELLDHFIQTLSEERRVDPPRLDEEARSALLAYSWPGNIRELRNVVERIVVLRCKRVVALRHLPAKIARPEPIGSGLLDEAAEIPPEGIDLRNALQDFEDRMIRQALLASAGNRNKAAKLLGLNRTTLVEKLRKRPVCDLAAAG
jgi:two-component system response regulator PilR (NtrC family)